MPTLVSTVALSPSSSRFALSLPLCNTRQVIEERKVDWSFEMEVSVLEIYNENIRDLLSDNPKLKLDVSANVVHHSLPSAVSISISVHVWMQPHIFQIKHGKEGPHVAGLSCHPVRFSCCPANARRCAAPMRSA